MTQAEDTLREAPGRPGGPPRWAHGSKTGVGTSRSETSLVWFTISRGVLNEMFFPRIDSPCTRDAFFIVTGNDAFFSDERDSATHAVKWIEDGVPGFEITTTCREGRYRIEKTILADDRLTAVLQQTRFTVLKGQPEDYRLHFYANPHLGGEGAGNTAWLEEFKGHRMLFASRGELALALASSSSFRKASVGFTEKSDGLEDLRERGQLAATYLHAERGNVGLIGELDPSNPEFVLAFGFGFGSGEAAHHALGALKNEFQHTRDRYVERWREWQRSLKRLDRRSDSHDLYRKSTATMLVHANKSIPGAVASLAVPWGEHRGDEDFTEGAYHMVWPRDLVNHGSGMIAIGAYQEAKHLLQYLRTTQESDGHWPQNMWVSGDAFWTGIQMDQTAQPILLADLALREGVLSQRDCSRYSPMVLKAASYIIRNGASTELDRWEEKGGFNAHAIATMIAALLTAAEWAEREGRRTLAISQRELADSWNERLESWLYVRSTPLARQLGVDGYYARILPVARIMPGRASLSEAVSQVPIFNDRVEQDELNPEEVVSVDALSLVRFGLRTANDPRVRNTVHAIDALLKFETERGPVWRRFNGDRFGEHENGAPFRVRNKGIGRAWPLLIGERAHYELARGDHASAEALLHAMENYANDSGFLPEQVWDTADLPEKGLFRGRSTGAACPLLWAHGEYLKLRRSIADRRVFDCPPQTAQRYA